MSDAPADGAAGREEAAKDVVEELVYECLQVGEGAVREILARHPAHAGRVRQVLDTLRGQQLLLDQGGSEERAVPDRVGGFRLLRRVGVGGMGVVYLAHEESLDREVALKLIRPELLYFPGSRERFRREVEAVARLSHAGIVPVHAVGEESGMPYFTMEYIEGASLAEVLTELRPRDPVRLRGQDLRDAVAAGGQGASASTTSLFQGGWAETCLRLVAQVAEALQHAHDRSVLHRDVKPSNILVSLDGRARLLDFGLAAMEDAQELTRSGSQLGSLPYMPPERLDGSGEQGPRADVYSLGATLYELLTLHSPYLRETAEATRRRILEGQPRRVSALNRNVGWDAETVCLTAMEREPARRYATAQELWRDIQNVLTLRPIDARRPGPVRRLRRWVHRHPTATVGLLLGSLLLVVAPLGFALYEKGLRKEAQTHLANFNRLAVVPKLRAARKAEETLYPAWPERIGAIEDWLERHAAPLTAMLPDLRDTLSNLRAAPAKDEAKVFLEETLARVLEELATFADSEQGEVARVRRRLAWARTVKQKTIDDHRARWTELREAIASSDRYAGLDLPPQTGLVPIGMDPGSRLFEFAHPRSGRIPERDPDTGKLRFDGRCGLVFVLLPGGRFFMGAQSDDPEAPNYDPAAQPAEAPVRRVTLSAFFLSKYEMTQWQWKRLSCGQVPSLYRAGVSEPGGQVITWANPVERVSREMSVELVRRHRLLLPTEAQWEYACRAGTSTPWWTGPDRRSLEGAVNIADRSAARANVPWVEVRDWPELDDGFFVHAPVHRLRANAFGLHQMHGNIWEWCRDGYTDYGTVPSPGDGLRAVRGARDGVLRGGCYHNTAGSVRSSARTQGPPETTNVDMGLRPARAVLR